MRSIPRVRQLFDVQQLQSDLAIAGAENQASLSIQYSESPTQSSSDNRAIIWNQLLWASGTMGARNSFPSAFYRERARATKQIGGPGSQLWSAGYRADILVGHRHCRDGVGGRGPRWGDG